MRKSLGNKRKQISDEQIAELTRLYGAFEEGPRVKIFPNESFGFLRITVERPLQLRWEITDDTLAVVAADKKIAKLPPLMQELLLAKLQANHGAIYQTEKTAKAAVRDALVSVIGDKPTPLVNAVAEALAVRDPEAPVITAKGKPKPDPTLRDNENVPLPPKRVTHETDTSRRLDTPEYQTAIDDYIEEEVHPYVPDAWHDPTKTKIGYEIPLTRHFYTYTPPRPPPPNRHRNQNPRNRNPKPTRRGDRLTWCTTRVDVVARRVKRPLDPRLLGDRLVDHYSIPFLESTGGPEVVPAVEIMSAKQLLKGGEVMVSRLNPRKARVIAVPHGSRVALASGEFVVMQPHSIEARFLTYLLLSETVRQYLDSRVQSVTRSHQRVRPEILMQMNFLVPEAQEQRAIADYLDIETGRIDALISKKRRMIELLEARWVALVVKTTRGSRREGNHIALRRVIDSTIGGAWGSPPGRAEIDAVCIRGTDFNTESLTTNNDSAPRRGLTHEEFRRRRLLDGDLVIEKSGGGDKQPVGRVVQWCGIEAGVPTNFAARLRPAKGVDSRYLVFLFRAAYESGKTRAWIKQTTGIQNLDLAGFLSEKYSIPSARDQSRIAQLLNEATSDLVQMRGKLNTQIGLLTERRQALITAAVTGEFSVLGVTV